VANKKLARNGLFLNEESKMKQQDEAGLTELSD